MKNKKSFVTVAAFLSASLFLFVTACSGAKQPVPGTQETKSSPAPETTASDTSEPTKAGGSLIVGTTTEPDYLDPYQATGADTRSLLFNVFEGLVKPDPDGNLQPAVAESLPDISEDGLTYTFKVRSGIKFHNGNAVTAEDVKYSLDKAREYKIAGIVSIDTVEVADTSTVKVTLGDADNSFLAYLTVAIVPKDYEEQNTKPVGTGPFVLESFTPQQSIVLKKNAEYWQEELPYLDEVIYKFKTDTNALLLDLQSGSVDYASVDYNNARQLGDSFTLVQSNSNAVQQLNLNNTFKPFSDIKVRQAVSHAVDPDEIINTVNFGKGVRVGTPVIPGLKTYYDASLTNAYGKDVDKAKQLLSEAGYADGFELTITVPSNYQVHVDTAQVIVNQLQAIGVKATIRQVDWATWLSQVYQGRQYEATIISVDGSSLTPESYLARYVSTSSSNFFNYSSAEYDALYSDAVKETDAARRSELFKQAQQLISRDAVNVFIQDISSFRALKQGFEGYLSYPLYVFDASTIYYDK